MLSARIPNPDYFGVNVTMVWDGFFKQAFGRSWPLASSSCGEPAVEVTPTGQVGCYAALLTGWELFNRIEGMIDHHLLQLHDVYEPMGLSI